MFRRILTAMVSIVLLAGFTVAEAHTLKLRIDTDGFADFDATEPALGGGGGSAFFVTGKICKENKKSDLDSGKCTKIGTFLCWGWIRKDGFAVVAQEYDLWGRGKIQVQGVEDDGPRAVTGGTKHFKNVRGEATGFNFAFFDNPDMDGEFIAKFRLIGARRRH